MNEKNNCDLCGLVVEVDDFKLATTEGDKHFCCEGCKGIYEMLHGQDILPEAAQWEQSKSF